ncbi:MAG: zf-HC2 domain-containing protein [Anaerolineae bacterium]|nr:zf-HC2 domain-containing protein [Anaerolineae bacterium]
MSSTDNVEPHEHKHDHKSGGCYPLEYISDYVDGELADELCRELEAHMEHCENCRVVVNTMTKTIMLYHQLPAPEMPDAVKERLYKVLNLADLHPKENGAE